MVFLPPGHRMEGGKPVRETGSSRTPADLQNSCRSPLTRDFPGVPKAPVVRTHHLENRWPGGGSTLILASRQTSCPGLSGHLLKHSTDLAYSHSCAASVTFAETSGVSAPETAGTAIELRWTQFDQKIHLRKGGSCRQPISHRSSSSMKGSVSIRGLYR